MTPQSKLRNKIVSASAATLITVLSMFGTTLIGAGVAKADAISDEAQFVKRINEDRVAGGLKPLTVHVALVDAGRSWATKMRDVSVAAGTDDCLISHNPNLRTAVNARWRKLGENVGCGDTDADTLHQAFMNSPKHRDNIMDPTFDSVGIGIVMAGDTMFVTEQFMQTDQRAPASTPAAPDALALKSPNVAGVSQVAAPAASAAPVKKTTKRQLKVAKKQPAPKSVTAKAPTRQGAF